MVLGLNQNRRTIPEGMPKKGGIFKELFPTDHNS